MDAEIRRLTYVQRFAGARQDSGANVGAIPLIGELAPFLRKDAASLQAPKPTDLRLETRILEMEREQEESRRRHREELAALEEKAAEERVAALHEQAEELTGEWASSVRTAIALFDQARAQYFADAEMAVVRLALAVAARVLHREAQMDPLLLRGPVRVALEEVQPAASCVLEVGPGKAEMWERWLSGQNDRPGNVQVREKADAMVGHCQLEIGASIADVSVDAQLAEIERGFFDLLERRTGTRDTGIRNEVAE